MQLKSFITQVLRDTRGATAVEYGLIMSLVVLTCLTAVQGVANANVAQWENVLSTVKTFLH